MTEAPNEQPIVGRSAEFEAFYQREYRKVLGLAYSLTGSREVAEDLAQEAFTAAYRSWSEVAVMDHPEAWTRRVVANRSASRFRRLSAEGRALIRTGKPQTEEPPPSTDSVVVGAAIRKLPRRQAEVIVLSYYGDLSDAEVAAVMGCSLNTARTHLKRARARLARELGEAE